MGEPDHVRAAGEGSAWRPTSPSASPCGCRRTRPARLAASPSEREQAEGLPRRQRPLPLHRQRVSRTGRSRAASSRSRSTSPTGARRSAREYTIDVADVLADVVAEGTSPSIQTSPLGFKPNVTGPDVVASYTEHVLRVAAHLVELEQRTGRTVTLAIEPEPFCFLETTDETVAYFEEHLYSGEAAAAARRGSPRIPISEAHSPSAGTSASCSTSATRRSSTRDIPRVAAEARRCRHPDLQAAGGGGAARPDGHGGSRGDADAATPTRSTSRRPSSGTATASSRGSSTSTTRSRPGAGSRAVRMAHPHPRARVPRRPRRLPHDAVRDRGRAPRSTRRARCRVSSRSRPTPGTCCPTALKTGDIVEYVCREIEWVRGELTA